MADDDDFVDLEEVDFGETIRGHQSGDVVFDRFKLKKLIGRGGMGVVWLAGDQRLDREVALKFTPESVRHDHHAVEELKKETQRGLDLAHPNIVRFFDFLQDDRFAAISMEYVDGETMGRLRVREESKVFQPQGIERWLRQMLAALDYAHRTAEIVHRDLKPANLLINRAGDLKITDFGIAASISESLNRTTGATMAMTGTLAYMSPQQALGSMASIDDDIYSLGCTLYELFTGKPPFYRGNIGLQVEDEMPPSIHQRRAEFKVDGAGDFPQLWDDVIQACLAKRTEDRPSSIAEVAARLGLQTGAIPEIGQPIDSSVGDVTRAVNVSVTGGQGMHTTGQNTVGVTVNATGSLTNLTSSGATVTATVPEGGGGYSVGHAGDRTKTLFVIAAVLLMLLVGGLFAYKGVFSDDKDDGGSDPKLVENGGAGPGVGKSKPPRPDPASGSDGSNGQAGTTDSGTKHTATDNKTQPAPEPPKPTVVVNRPPPKPPEPSSPFTVPGKFGSIQEAIDAAKSGDTITIANNTYEEMLTLRDGVRLEAESEGGVIVQADIHLGAALSARNCRTGSVDGIRFNFDGMFQGDPESVEAKKKVYPLLHIISSSIKVTNCSFSGASDGVVITGAGESDLDDCNASNNTLSGFKVERGARATLSNCVAESNGDHGFVSAWNGHATIKLSKGNRNGKSGLSLEAEGTAVLTRSNFEENNAAGIILLNGGNTLEMNGGKASKNEMLGIMTFTQEDAGAVVINGGMNKVVLDGVTVSGNKQDGGIFVYYPHPESVIRYCILNGNVGLGIYIGGEDGHEIFLDRNDVRGSIDGIMLEGVGLKVSVVGNVSTKNSNLGIHAGEGVIGEISGNNCAGNSVSGISPAVTRGELVIKGNTSS